MSAIRTKAEERRILDLMATSAPDLSVNPVVEPEQIIAARDIVNQIYIDDRVKDYIVDVVWATREPASYRLELDGLIRYGASPRATIYLALARPRLRFPERPRLRHAAGCQEHRAGRPAPPRHRQLRSGSREPNERDDRSNESLPDCRCREFTTMERRASKHPPKFSKKSARSRSRPKVSCSRLSPAITTAFSKDAG